MNHLRWIGHSATIFDIQKCLKSEHQTCDVTLVGKGNSVKAHRFVLSSSSDLLRDLLSNIPVGEEATVVIPDIKGNLLDCVLSFVYIGETSLTSANLSDFLEAISILGIKSAISFECANAQTIVNHEETEKNAKPVDEHVIEMEVNEEVHIPRKTEQETPSVIDHPRVRELEFLEEYNEPQKIAYSFEQINANNSTGSEYILTETSGRVTLTTNPKIEENITVSSTYTDSNEEKAEDEECEENDDGDESGQLIEQYDTSGPLLEQFDSSADSSAVLVKRNEESLTASECAANSFGELKAYTHFNETQAHRNESLQNAAIAVVDEGMSLQKAAQKFNISKTVLWRRVKKHPLYMKTHRENPVLESACERLKTGDSLKNISIALDIPMSTLHRHKVRLAQEGRLPDYVTFKKRGPLSKEVLKDKLDKAVKACLDNGMSQNHAANLYEVPKSTLWRHVQKKISAGELIANIKEEIILS